MDKLLAINEINHNSNICSCFILWNPQGIQNWVSYRIMGNWRLVTFIGGSFIDSLSKSIIYLYLLETASN